MKKTKSNVAVFILLIFVLSVFSSCRRGYGCPGDNLKVEAIKLTVSKAWHL